MTHASTTFLVEPLPLPRRQDNPWMHRALIIAAIVLLVDAVFGERGLAQTARARQAYIEAQARLAAIQNSNAGLREQARRLFEDSNTIEDVARKELGLMRDGEVMFVVKSAR